MWHYQSPPGQGRWSIFVEIHQCSQTSLWFSINNTPWQCFLWGWKFPAVAADLYFTKGAGLWFYIFPLTQIRRVGFSLFGNCITDQAFPFSVWSSHLSFLSQLYVRSDTVLIEWVRKHLSKDIEFISFKRTDMQSPDSG